jgi:hypothetical protein
MVGVGCKKEAAGPTSGVPTAPVSTQDQDALWKLAPEGATLGFVASPRGVAMAERGIIAIHALLATAPELAPINRELERGLTETAGSPNPTLADFGLVHDKGAAVFQTKHHGPVVILPVGDRDKFLAKLHGTKGVDTDTLFGITCKTINNAYACAERPDGFAKLGQGDLGAMLATAGTRGDLELVVHGFPDPETPNMAVVAQLDRGAIVVRGTVTGVPRAVTNQLGAPLKPRSDAASATGFGVINLAPHLADLPPLPIAPKLTLADLGKSVVGPLTFAVARGTTNFDLRLPLRDPGPAKALLEHCADLPPLAQAGATVKDGACHVPIPQVGFAIDGRVEGNELRIATQWPGPTSTDSAVSPSPMATELASGAWSVAFYGHGTLLGATIPPQLAAMEHLPDEARMALRALMMVNELAVGVSAEADTIRFVVGVRTAWANPEEVFQKLVAISPDQVIAGKAAGPAKSIADAAPDSPFAQDLKAGTGGVMALAAPFGIYAAVAIPAFMDYTKRSKKTEAALQLNKLGKSAKRTYSETSAYPVGNVPLTPAKPCCSGPNGHCPVSSTTWEHPVWKALDFEIDEPTLFQYSYQSDGKTFTAKAVGDLDCDGIPITYELRGTSDGGNPAVQLTEPPPNSD